jgi:hypothetical protein
MNNYILSLLAVTVSLPLFSQTVPSNFSYKLLKDSRLDLVLPTYTLAEKKIVIDQAQLVMNDIFVHRDLKLATFGTEIDPIPMIKKLSDQVEGLSDRALHRELIQIFQKQYDRHTTYVLPEPYACYRSLLPVAFKEVVKRDGTTGIFVSSLSEIPEIQALSPNLALTVGDELLQYEGKEVEEAIQLNMPLTFGANAPAMRRRGISLLSFKSQKFYLAPVDDSITMTLKNRQGQVYTASLQWIARGDLKCLNKETPTARNSQLASDDFQIEFNQIFRKQNRPHSNKSLAHEAFKTTPEPTLKYRIVRNEYGDYGHILLESFLPEKLSVLEVAEEIKKILLGFEKTDGLIIDLRDNGGGYIQLAHIMVQLFTPADQMQLLFRLKNSAANRHYMYTTQSTDDFTIALREAEARGDQYTLPLPFYKEGALEKIGQYYFRPVSVFTNANCYSSCDMFSALMQDQKAAIIFGEDSTTGAGGANNHFQASFVKSLNEDLGPFQKLPASQDMVFAFRQSIRTGPSAGVLIENMGILSDQLARTSITDLYTDSAEQFKTIGKALNEISSTRKAWIKIKEGRQDLRTNEPAKIFMQWMNTDHIVFKSKGSISAQINVHLNNSAGSEISLPIQEKSYHAGVFDIYGSKDGKRVWRKRHNYRTVPEFASIETTTDMSPLLAFYRYNANDGWTWKNDELVSNVADNYTDSMNSHSSLFLNLSQTKSMTLQFEAAVDVEKDFDYFRVKLLVEGKDVTLIQGLTGSSANQSFSFDLSEHKGKKVEIKFIFESDGGVVGKGVRMKNIKLTTPEA